MMTEVTQTGLKKHAAEVTQFSRSWQSSYQASEQPIDQYNSIFGLLRINTGITLHG